MCQWEGCCLEQEDILVVERIFHYHHDILENLSVLPQEHFHHGRRAQRTRKLLLVKTYRDRQA